MDTATDTATGAATDSTLDPVDKTAPGWFGSAGGWLEMQRNVFSEVVSDSAQGLDAYVARGHFDQSLSNDSYLKVQLKQRTAKSGEHNIEASVRAKVKLPNSRRRLKLTFDSDPDDFDRLADRNRDQTPGFNSPKTLTESAIAGISLEQYLSENWDRSYSMGVRLQLPINTYVRAKWTHTGSLGEHWKTRFKQGFSYFHTDRWKSETGQTFYRPLNDSLLFQSSSGAQYLDRDDNWELYQNLSLHQRISADSAFEHQLGVSGDSRPALKTSGYWLRTEFRHRLYKNWLFVKLVPELYYARDDHFQSSPSLLFELEIYFGKAPD
ncbi:MAG: hypothetical protein V7629_14065 [Motiliproteus sp.]